MGHLGLTGRLIFSCIRKDRTGIVPAERKRRPKAAFIMYPIQGRDGRCLGGAWSSLAMTITAEGVSRVAFAGLESSTVNDSSASGTVSPLTWSSIECVSSPAQTRSRRWPAHSPPPRSHSRDGRERDVNRLRDRRRKTDHKRDGGRSFVAFDDMRAVDRNGRRDHTLGDGGALSFGVSIAAVARHEILAGGAATFSLNPLTMGDHKSPAA